MNEKYDIAEAFERIEEKLIKSMVENLTNHLTEEKLNNLEYSQWQTLQLNALKNFRSSNAKLFKKDFEKINKEIKKELNSSYDIGATTSERDILKHYVGESKSIEDKSELYKIHNEKLTALIDESVNSMSNAESAILRYVDDNYRKIIFDSEVYLNTGSGTLTQAIDMATKDFLSQGLNCIRYKNGMQMNVSSYAEMALRTANTRATLEGESLKRDVWGLPLVMITYRSSACPLCARYIGKVFVDDVWGNVGKDYQSKYPKLSTAISGGLYHPNCKDSHTTYFEGITKRRVMTKEEEAEAIRRYDLQQKQRYNERQIRKYKRLEQGSVDSKNKEKYGEKRKYWQRVNNDFIKEHDDILRRDYSREKVRVFDNTISSIYVYKPVRNETEAITSLEGLFKDTQKSITKIDANLLVDNTNQLNKLDSRFKAIKKSSNSIIRRDSRISAVAYVSTYTNNFKYNELVLNGNYFDSESMMRYIVKENVNKGHFTDININDLNKLSIYTTTHEYGHILSHVMVSDYFDYHAMTANKQNFYNVLESFNKEIVDIFNKNNPGENVSKYISKYGKSNADEFFAEVFAGAMLDSKNKLCEAMNEWLILKGY